MLGFDGRNFNNIPLGSSQMGERMDVMNVRRLLAAALLWLICAWQRSVSQAGFTQVGSGSTEQILKFFFFFFLLLNGTDRICNINVLAGKKKVH